MINPDPLRSAIASLPAEQAAEIRESYYRALEGLRGLVEQTERVEGLPPEQADKLIGEHLLACQALDAMKKSELGRVV